MADLLFTIFFFSFFLFVYLPVSVFFVNQNTGFLEIIYTRQHTVVC